MAAVVEQQEGAMSFFLDAFRSFVPGSVPPKRGLTPVAEEPSNPHKVRRVAAVGDELLPSPWSAAGLQFQIGKKTTGKGVSRQGAFTTAGAVAPDSSAALGGFLETFAWALPPSYAYPVKLEATPSTSKGAASSSRSERLPEFEPSGVSPSWESSETSAVVPPPPPRAVFRPPATAEAATPHRVRAPLPERRRRVVGAAPGSSYPALGPSRWSQPRVFQGGFGCVFLPIAKPLRTTVELVPDTFGFGYVGKYMTRAYASKEVACVLMVYDRLIRSGVVRSGTTVCLPPVPDVVNSVPFAELKQMRERGCSMRGDVGDIACLVYPNLGITLKEAVETTEIQLLDLLAAFQDVLGAVEMLAAVNLCHMDIKADNIMVAVREVRGVGHVLAMTLNDLGWVVSGDTLSKKERDAGNRTIYEEVLERRLTKQHPPDLHLFGHLREYMRKRPWLFSHDRAHSQPSDIYSTSVNWGSVADWGDIIHAHETLLGMGCGSGGFRHIWAAASGGSPLPPGVDPRACKDAIRQGFSRAQGCVDADTRLRGRVGSADAQGRDRAAVKACATEADVQLWAPMLEVLARNERAHASAKTQSAKHAVEALNANIRACVYSPPLQCRVAKVDVFSLGVVLFEMLCTREAEFRAFPQEVQCEIMGVVARMLDVHSETRATPTEAADLFSAALESERTLTSGK